jgi:hypothetical protein
MEAKTYICPECAGHPLRYRHVRIKRADGDHIERWPNVCGLCEGEGRVSLDQIVERADADQIGEYVQRIVQRGQPGPQPAMTEEVSDIPF